MEAFLRYHSDKIRQTYYQFTVLTQKNMEARMAEAILYLSKTVFCNAIIKGISKQDLADFTAMSRESTIRVLKDFKDEGFIDLDRQDIKVIHAESLQKIASLG
jgi:CRP/FNR family transcriptional regulator